MAKINPFDKHANQYDGWFEKNRFAYWSEVSAVECLLPEVSFRGIEIGVGTGRFALPLEIQYGIDPSRSMREIALKRGIKVEYGVAEKIPFEDLQFDLVLMVTSICFFDDVLESLREAHRVLIPSGYLVIGFIDKHSFLGRKYEKSRSRSKFYRFATFYSADDVAGFLKQTGFDDQIFVQTIFHPPGDLKEIEHVKNGYGEGSFVVVRAKKRSLKGEECGRNSQ